MLSEVPMPLLDDRVQKQVRAALADVTHPIKLVMFTQGEGGALECGFCGETRQLVEEVAALSDRIELDVRDFEKDADLARQYGVDKIPAIVVLSGGAVPKPHGIRLYGIPSGYEFSSFLEALKMVGRGEAPLSPATTLALQTITRPVHIQVFVTPT
jgi:alkyl hydroperoxide reductase subunit AhpF